MGWAKYAEDNFEIINERFSQMEERKSHYTTELVTIKLTVNNSSVVKAEKVSATVKREEKCIICKDCGKVFIFSVRDQLFYDKMGWNPPKRCRTCREQRKNQHIICPAY